MRTILRLVVNWGVPAIALVLAVLSVLAFIAAIETRTSGPGIVYWQHFIYFKVWEQFNFFSTAVIVVDAAFCVVIYVRKRAKQPGVRVQLILLGLTAPLHPLLFMATPSSFTHGMDHVATAYLNQHVYYLAHYDYAGNESWYALYECDSVGFWCNSVWGNRLQKEVADSAYLTVDAASNSVTAHVENQQYTYQNN